VHIVSARLITVFGQPVPKGPGEWAMTYGVDQSHPHLPDTVWQRLARQEPVVKSQESKGLIALVVFIAVAIAGSYFMMSRVHGHKDAYSPPPNAPVANLH
jgi:hypothetical protein